MREQATPPMPRGIRKVSEHILADKRALIFTEEDASKLNWEDIPFGSIKVNDHTGMMSVKLKGALLTNDGHFLENAHVNLKDKKVYRRDGTPYMKPNKVDQYRESDIQYTSETDWLPAGIKNDGTICIAKDAIIMEEVFTITKPNERLESGENGFSYKVANGETRHMPKRGDNGYIFELEKGNYVTGRNFLDVYVDGILRRNASSGTIEELTETRFMLNDVLEAGQEVVARYVKMIRIGNPYPRIFLTEEEPDTGENGDFWLNREYDELLDPNTGERVRLVNWEDIAGKPTTLEEYGFELPFAREGHVHRWNDIIGKPMEFSAAGGNADTVAEKKPGTEKNDLLVLGEHGKIPAGAYSREGLEEAKIITCGEAPPAMPKEYTLWFDTTPNRECIKMYIKGNWITFGGAWKG